VCDTGGEKPSSSPVVFISPSVPRMVGRMRRGVVVMAIGRFGRGESFERGDFSPVSKNYRWAADFRGQRALELNSCKDPLSLICCNPCIE
jgi:hypothetical protein